MSDFDDNAQDVPWEKGSKFEYMNATKRFTLEKYQKVFSGLRISDIKGAPIMIPRPRLMAKVEEIYNDIVQDLLRKKNPRVLNLPKATREYVKRQNVKNPNYFIQSLADLIYSADKHGDHPETAQFLKFLTGPVGDRKLLYYLYCRQIYKLEMVQSFLNNKGTFRDPTKLDMRYTDAVEIVDDGFYFDKVGRNNLRAAVKAAVKPKQRITYYRLMMTLVGAGWENSKIDLISYLVALYRVKPKQEIADENALTMDVQARIQARMLRKNGGQIGRAWECWVMAPAQYY